MLLPVDIVTAVDIAAADTTNADFTVVMTGARTPARNIIILDKWVKRGVTPTDTIAETFRQMRTWYSRRAYIERNRFEFLKKQVKQLIDTGFFGEPYEVEELLSRCVMVPHYTNKEERITDILQPPHRSKRIWLQEGWTDIQEQLVTYPLSIHDDLLDTLQMIVEKSKVPDTTLKDLATEQTSDRVSRSQQRTASNDVNAYFARKRVSLFTGR